MATHARIWPVRVLAKICVFRNMRDSPDSPTFAKHIARARQTHQHLPNRFAMTRQTSERRVWRVFREFGEFVKSG
jgi:hypothetical protein